MATKTEYDLPRRLAAEGMGTALLVATVVGSGIMASRLSADAGLQLLGNTVPTGAILVVLISLFGPISGAHFNPVVSLVLMRVAARPLGETLGYCGAQIAGSLLGTMLAHAMFQVPILVYSVKMRTGPAQWLAEVVATFGLVVVVLAARHLSLKNAPVLIGLYITAAYWFTASTAFANPAVTLARSITDTFSGIAPANVPAFIAAQMLGGALAVAVGGWLFQQQTETRGDQNARRHLS